VLHVLARDLCRLMAPILCFTAEEVWQELEALEGRDRWGEETVHAQVFPEPSGRREDAALLARWSRLIEIREEVAKALEAARAARIIGGSLDAAVVLDAPDDARSFLATFGDELRFLFLTSRVEFAEVSEGAFVSERVLGLRIAVEPAGGAKCARCWHHTTDVGADPEWPEACGRCVASIRATLADAGA
jgi:isoleucyl-tRNA synthetase